MFCSTSIGMHLFKGVAAFTLIALAIYLGSSQLLLAVPMVIGAIFLLRGCPMCWLKGLLKTIENRRKQKSEQA
ncbi:hypothetical protein [Janthinobacterium sp.]|uniref:hypothetical protein n=1 Tax=Janthinobacterium sp. TaxID=1871054 RepID=UPI00293D72DB|nr:hypothetical protein [Janthinobacterium sp.]